MKKLVLGLAIAGVLFSCGNKDKTETKTETETEIKNEYVTFSGKITNMNSDSISIRAKGYAKRIEVKEDGSFSDTLDVSPGFFVLFDGGEYSRLYLKNGYNLNMTLDTEQFDKSISYTGEGAENSNFLADKIRFELDLFDINTEGMTIAELDTKFNEIEASMNQFIDSKSNVDPEVIDNARKGLAADIKGEKNYLADIITLRNALPKGAKSPVFENYENYAGGLTSLTDLKGKYVYVDVWATWCAPCKAEIPSLKKVETDYHDKNIEFVSVSVDELKDHPKWKDMVNDKSLGGVQLYADNSWKSQFVKDYFINGIPRFILIDPKGNVVTPDAPRPSDPKLRAMLDKELL